MFKCGPHQNNSHFLLFPKFFWEPKTLLSCLKSLKCDLGIVYSLENLEDIIHKGGWGGWYEFILACRHFVNNEEFWSMSRIHFQVYYYVASIQVYLIFNSYSNHDEHGVIGCSWEEEIWLFHLYFLLFLLFIYLFADRYVHI